MPDDRSSEKNEKRIAALLGIGFEQDGHTRLSWGKDHVVGGGDEKVHEWIAALCRRIETRLDRERIALADLEIDELKVLISEAVEEMPEAQ